MNPENIISKLGGFLTPNNTLHEKGVEKKNTLLVSSHKFNSNNVGKLPVLDYSAFLYPNEEEPEKSKDIFTKAPEGAYVGVGTERCLFAPYLNEKFTYIIMADYDKRANIYNEINLELIKASTDRQTYKELRFAKTFEDFKHTLQRCGYANKESDINLYDINTFNWFKNAISNTHFKNYHNGLNSFSEVSYIHNDEAYKKVKNLADTDKIIIKKFDVGDSKDIEDLGKTLNSQNIKISIYDISNAWWQSYVSLDKSPDRSFILGPDAFAKDGIVLVTDRYYAKPWYYMGFRQDQLKKQFQDHDGILRQIFTVKDNREKKDDLIELFGKNEVNKVVDLGAFSKKESMLKNIVERPSKEALKAESLKVRGKMLGNRSQTNLSPIFLAKAT